MYRTGKGLQSFLIVLLLLGLMEVGPSPEARANLNPSEVVMDIVDTVRKIKKSDPDEHKVLSPQEKERNGVLSRHVNRLVDIEGISAYALWHHWETQKPTERTCFVALFTELLEKVAYTNAGKFLRDLTVSVRQEKVVRNRAMVYTSVVHEEEGRIDIDFKLQLSENAWLVHDVLLDGVSLARNLRTQCLKIIHEDSFEELLDRMREKIEDEDPGELK
jgi:phospholipid transport system substrate-binding protein